MRQKTTDIACDCECTAQMEGPGLHYIRASYRKQAAQVAAGNNRMLRNRSPAEAQAGHNSDLSLYNPACMLLQMVRSCCMVSPSRAPCDTPLVPYLSNEVCYVGIGAPMAAHIHHIQIASRPGNATEAHQSMDSGSCSFTIYPLYAGSDNAVAL